MCCCRDMPFIAGCDSCGVLIMAGVACDMPGAGLLCWFGRGCGVMLRVVAGMGCAIIGVLWFI